MKYLLAIDHIATGGAERILIDYYHYLAARNNSIMVFVLSGHSGQSAWTEGLDVVYGSNADEDNLLRKTGQQIGLYFKLQKLVREYKPDVIFSFLEKSNLLTDLVKSNATKVMTVHNVLSIQYTKVKSSAVRKVLYAIIRRMYNRCQNVVAVSKQVKDDLVSSFGVKAQNIKVVNNYVDKKDIEEKARQQVNDFTFRNDRKYIINVGRFSDQKAQWKLIKAFSLYLSASKGDDVELILMGNGDYRDNLSSLANELGIKDKVHILPFKTNPYKYMAKANLFVLSSIFEGFPIVLAEASSLRIPFVGTDKAVPEEMFDDEKFWEKCIFRSSNLEKDFSVKIHKDEQILALLIHNGIGDPTFRQEILDHTKAWEHCNNKSIQFDEYEHIVNSK